MNVEQVYRRARPPQEQPHQNPFAFQLANPLAEQIDLFDDPERWPRKPYCAAALEGGIYPRSLKSALRRPYIQANPPHLRVWSIFDVDRAGGGLAWEDGRGLPPPAWTTINRENAHAHLVWGLRAPVLVESPDARRAPIRYLVAIEAAFRAHLQADAGYSGLITKNPAHPMWRTFRGPQSSQAYELDYLAEWVELPRFLPKQGVLTEEIGLGRNCILFDFLRKWAYKAVRQERAERSFSTWKKRVEERALARNADFRDPMHFQEVGHIAKSVAKWVWTQDPKAEQRFKQTQAYRGRKSGEARLLASEDKRSSARLMAAKGMSTRAIATELEVNQSTVSRWLRG